MTKTNDKFGDILSPVLWDNLATEYLKGPGWGSWNDQQVAERNARTLAAHVDDVVTVTDTGYEYQGVPWVESYDPEPYDGLDSLTTALVLAQLSLGDEPVLVSNQYCTHPVWTPSQNVKFRVWHDSGHVFGHHGFDPDGELRLFAAQARQLLVHPFGQELVDALFSESVYQLAACIALDGFPDEQFVRVPGPVGRKVLELLLQVA